MKNMLRSLIVLLGIGGLLLALPGTSMAAEVTGAFDEICRETPDATVCKDAEKKETPDDNSLYGPNGMLIRIANFISLIVGIAAVIMIIIGGLKFVLATGDSAQVNSAKNTVLFAIVGLVVTVLAQAIIRFVISKL